MMPTRGKSIRRQASGPVKKPARRPFRSRDLRGGAGSCGAGCQAVAGRTSVVEDDRPLAVRSPPPDRVVGADALSGRIAHRPGAQAQGPGVVDLDPLGLPGEGRLLALVEPLP